jgi:hypothetical protein
MFLGAVHAVENHRAAALAAEQCTLGHSLGGFSKTRPPTTQAIATAATMSQPWFRLGLFVIARSRLHRPFGRV